MEVSETRRLSQTELKKMSNYVNTKYQSKLTHFVSKIERSFLTPTPRARSNSIAMQYILGEENAEF